MLAWAWTCCSSSVQKTAETWWTSTHVALWSVKALHQARRWYWGQQDAAEVQSKCEGQALLAQIHEDVKPRVVFHSSAEPVLPPPYIHPPTTNYLTYNYHRLKPHSSLGDFVVYGGMGLDNMSAASDLCQLRLKGERQIYVDVTLMKQHDDVPSARFGHKMTKIDEQSVLVHGGLSLDLRSSDHFVQDTFGKCWVTNILTYWVWLPKHGLSLVSKLIVLEPSTLLVF